MELEQNSAYNVHPSTSTVRPSSTLSETSDGYIPMGDGYEDVNGYEPPTMTVVDNQAYSGESTQMTIVDNQAYSGDPPRYDYIYPNTGNTGNSTELYEQIPDRVEQQPPEEKRVSMGKALCSYKQGKAEIGIRMSILSLGGLIILLQMAAFGLSFIGGSIGSFIVNLLGTICPGLIIFIASVEFGMFFGRICTKRTSKCFVIWDIVHSIIVTIFYFLCAIGATLSAGFSGGIALAMYTIVAIVCLVQMVLYMVKAYLMSAFFKKEWGQKVKNPQGQTPESWNDEAIQKRVSMGRALCSFKHGKAEIGIRIFTLIMGGLIIVLHLSAMIGVGLATGGPSDTLLFVLCGTVGPGFVFIIGFVELGMYFARICKKRTSKCFATWDIVHSSTMSIFYFLFAIGATAITAVSSLEASTTVFDNTGLIIGAVIYAAVTIVCLVQMVLYIVKAYLMSAFFKKGWDQKVEDYNRALPANNQYETV